MILPQPKSVFEQLFGDGAVTPDMESSMPDLFRLVRQAKVWRQMLGEKTLCDALPDPRAVRPYSANSGTTNLGMTPAA